MRLAGYAMKYGFRDHQGRVYAQGCLEDTDLSNVKASDGNNTPYGTTNNALLELMVDDRGLRFILQLHDRLSYIPDLVENIRIKNIKGVGVIGTVHAEKMDGQRTITKIDRVQRLLINSMIENEHSSIGIYEDADMLTFAELKELDEAEREREALRMKIELCDL